MRLPSIWRGTGNPIIAITVAVASGVEARNGTDRSLTWSQATDCVMPAHNWVRGYNGVHSYNAVGPRQR